MDAAAATHGAVVPCFEQRLKGSSSWFQDMAEPKRMRISQDDQGVTREGRLKVHEVWSLSTRQRIVVPFSAQGQEAIGEAAGLLGGFLGIVGTDLTTFPISYRAWCQIPHSYKDTCFDIIKAKFCFDHNIQKHFVLKKLGQNWRNYRVYLFQKYYDDTKSREANLPNHPNFIPRDMWVALVDSELSTQEMSRMNCQNRKEKVDDLRQEVARLRSELHTSNQLLHSELQLLKKQQEDMRVAVIYVFQNLVGDVPPQFAHLLNP
ncbi:mucin-1-like isoform X4 [Senna tora]|uniref:Mucin-1-like isoform X4 n=1 Tax=Senna tora TaxID=362788 RepID=A0A835C8D2_9FABA|nr:mucin-1-like isoform X4 [Senna tora]